MTSSAQAYIKSIDYDMSADFSSSVTVSMVVHGQDREALGRLCGMGSFDLDSIAPGKPVIKCQHCGQWGARKCACKYCGAPID